MNNAERINTYDTLTQIECCQRCTLPECANCVDHPTAKKRSVRQLRFLALYEQGFTDQQLSTALRVSRSTIYGYRKRNGMPPNPQRPTTDPCPTCHSRKICDGIGGTCGEKVRWVERETEGTG